MIEQTLNHNQQPALPIQEVLKGTETSFDATSIPLEWPNDLNVENGFAPGTELHAIIGLGSPTESGTDQMSLLRLPTGEWSLAGVRPNKQGEGRIVGQTVVLQPSVEPMVFGRGGDEQLQSGIIGGRALYQDRSKPFSGLVSGVHLMGHNDGTTVRIKDGSISRPSSNHTFVERMAPSVNTEESEATIPRDRLKAIKQATLRVGNVALANVAPIESLSPKEKRLQSLFAPRPEGLSQAEQEALDDAAFERRLDEMFMADDELAARKSINYIAERSAANSKKKEFNVTGQTLADAVTEIGRVRLIDPGLNSILAEFNLANAQPENVAAAVRTDPSVRLAVGKHYFDRINQLADSDPDIPERVRRNGQKKPDNGAYPDGMTSREYVALLCVAKLDATFDQAYSERLTSDHVERNDSQQITQGQHRYAASRALYTRM